MNERPVRSDVMIAVIESALSVVAVGALYLLARPGWRMEWTPRVRAAWEQASGATARDWMRSPRAAFARHNRDAMIAAEFADTDCGCEDINDARS